MTKAFVVLAVAVTFLATTGSASATTTTGAGHWYSYDEAASFAHVPFASEPLSVSRSARVDLEHGDSGVRIRVPPTGLAAKARGRFAQDVGVNSTAPRALATTRSIGRASHDAALQADLAALPAGARNIRVNQQQVNALGQRVGINRPDLQYTLNGRRYYVEYEGPGNPRGAAHRARILANDPNASFILRIVP